MNTTTFLGEQLLPGQIGYFLTILSLVASLVATFAFAKSFYAKELVIEMEWKRFAKIAFIIEAIAIFLCFVVLLCLLWYLISYVSFYISVYYCV